MAGLEIGERFAGYVLEEVVGDGELSIVYRARHPFGEETVALKVFRDDAADELDVRRRFADDVHARRIAHPHVIRVLDAGEEGGRSFLVTQFVGGPTLRQVIADLGRLEPALAATVAGQVSEALDTAHATGLVHRNVAPENIVLAPDLTHAHAYLSDFALSRGAVKDRVTQIGTMIGSGACVSPEMVIGTQDPDARADVYSLACVLFECLSGRLAFPAENEVMGIFARISQPPPSILEAAPDLDPRWEGVLTEAMATDPDDRTSTAGELGRAARAVAGVAV